MNLIQIIFTIICSILLLCLLAVASLGGWVILLGIQAFYHTIKELKKNGKKFKKEEEKDNFK